MLVALIIHLFSVIVFVGYVFADALLASNKGFNSGFKKALLKKGGMIYGLSFVLIIISGGYLMHAEYFTLSKAAKCWLFIKLALLALMLVLTAISIVQVRILKLKRSFLIDKAHLIALSLCALIVLAAKLISFN